MAADVQIRFKAESSEARAEIDLLRKEIGYLREGFKRTQEAATVGNNALARFRGETIALTHVFVSSIDDFGGALNQFDRRFLGFHERVDAFTGAIHRLPPEITAVRDAFDVLAPTAARVEAVFADIQLSLVDTETEALAFRNVFSLLSHDLTSFAADQAIATAEIRLVNPAISAAVVSMSSYNDVMSEGVVNFREVVDISEDVTASVRTQASAFDELRRSVDGVSQSQSGLQGQQLGSGVFESFNPQTPGSRSFSDGFGGTLGPVSLQLGEELASQAISTAGDLLRIERDRVESLSDLEREYSERIIAINEVKRQKLAEVEQAIETERVRRLASIQQAFDAAKEAEISARQETADRILKIEQDAAAARNRLGVQLNRNIFALEQERDARIRELNEGRVERERERQQEILTITERATQARAEAEARYAERVQDINNRLVLDIRNVQTQLTETLDSLEDGFVDRQADRAEEIVRITEDAAAARTQANEQFSETMQGIYNNLVTAWDALEDGFVERERQRADQLIEIEQDAADAREKAYQGYTDQVARISTDLVDTVRRIQDEIQDVEAKAIADRQEIEEEALEARVDANAEYARQIQEIEADTTAAREAHHQRLLDIEQRAIDARLDAERSLSEKIQDIQNDLVDEVTDIQQGLNDTLNDLRDEQLEAERDRQQSLVDLHEETQQKLEDLERDRTRTIQDLNQKLRDDIYDARLRAHRRIEDLNENTGLDEAERAERIAKVEEALTRRIEDLTRDRNRRIADLGLEQRRQREDLARQASAKEVEIAERTQAQLSGIAEQQTDAQAEARVGIADAESAAGVAFREAQQHYVPALSAYEQALLEHTAALNRINQETATATEAANQALTTAVKEGFDVAAIAATTLSEALIAVTAAELERLAVVETDTAATVAGLQGQRSAAETRTGLTFEQALENYTPVVDLNTQALQALTTALGQADADEIAALTGVGTAGVEDRATTDAAQAALETGAGVSIEDARANFVPALSSAAQATLTLNATMQALDTSFRETIEGIYTAGLVDRQSVDLAIQTAIAEATAQQTALETQAGTTFAEASLAFQPGLSDIAQAGVDQDTTLAGINETEIEDIEGVNAQSIADRLETDAAVTETRDAFLKASAQERLKYETEIRQINNAMRLDIREVKDALKVNLESIDDTLDVELAEIREQKLAFDTKMNELITAVNAQGNQDLATLNADTAAMRSSLEAIAEEARDSAWKDAILKVANVGITIAGVAAGTALGNPVAGLAVGQAVGGLVEQGGQELFHFESTDAIAHRMARSAAFRRPRPAPNYLPTPDQLRNARDVGREVVAGFTEGLSQRNSGFGNEGASQQSGFPEEITATLQIQFPDGTVQELRDQIIRLEAQDR